MTANKPIAPKESPPAPPPAPSPAHEAAWSGAELADPHTHSEKAEKVRRMFGAIANSYDLNNRVHSLGRDQAWRRAAVRAARPRAGDIALDVACGTGDLTRLLAASEAPTVIGLDFTHAMLCIARDKRARAPAEHARKISYIEGDAQHLPLADACVDVITIAFGIRNVTSPDAALREFARVARPGARLVILEFARPRWALVRWFNDVYCARIMPRTATWLARDRSGAYRYLPASVGTFMEPAELENRMSRAGFVDVSSRPLSFGICRLYRGVRG